jgi:hypothetical protein
MDKTPTPFTHTERPAPRSVLVGFRVNEREREILRELASEAGMSVTALVRAALAERVQQLHSRS